MLFSINNYYCQTANSTNQNMLPFPKKEYFPFVSIVRKVNLFGTLRLTSCIELLNAWRRLLNKYLSVLTSFIQNFSGKGGVDIVNRLRERDDLRKPVRGGDQSSLVRLRHPGVLRPQARIPAHRLCQIVSILIYFVLYSVPHHQSRYCMLSFVIDDVCLWSGVSWWCVYIEVNARGRFYHWNSATIIWPQKSKCFIKLLKKIAEKIKFSK